MNNILISISVILNGVLLSFLWGLVPFLLYLSAVINVLLAWYAYKALQNVGDVQEDLLEILKSIENFSDELDEVHGMEMFYGEPVLQGLINHSRTVNNDIIDVLEKYYDIRVEEIDDEEDNPQEEEESILYQGS
jgi:hypothetical protein